MEECLQLFRKLTDYKIRLPESLTSFAGIARSVGWLMDVAEQSGLELVRTPLSFVNLKYPFEQTLSQLLADEHLFDNINIRTLVRLERSYPPGVFPYNPALYTLSSRSTRRVCQKELEELLVSGSLVHVEDLKHLLRKWAFIDHEFVSLPAEMKNLLDGLKSFKHKIKHMLQNAHKLTPLSLETLPFARECLEGVSGYGGLVGLEGQFDAAQRVAVMLLNFSVKVQKILLFTYPGAGSGVRFSQLEEAENECSTRLT